MDDPERYGSYLVYEQIGKGGMATVHRAEQRTANGVRQVALKRLFPTLQRELVMLFLDEAKLLRHLEHPNIATTYDSGRVFGTYFIAMEYVPGPTMKELVEHCRVTVGSVPPEITLNLAAQLCDALDHAHNAHDKDGHPLGIIHRDVTPANIIISEAGLVKLIDFGLAKAKVTTEQTAVGVIKGKFGYVAPEYVDGKLDHRADLWAVGILMYELLTSRRLFDGADAFETMMRVREMPIPRPSLANPAVSRELDAIVMTALERNPEKRWPSAAAMRERILEVIAQSGTSSDHKSVADWVTWAFEQQRGRAPQLTPAMPMPIQALLRAPFRQETATAEVSAEDLAEGLTEGLAEVAEVAEKIDPMAAVALPPAPPLPPFVWTLQNIVWTACAGALVLLLLVALAWKLVG